MTFQYRIVLKKSEKLKYFINILRFYPLSSVNVTWQKSCQYQCFSDISNVWDVIWFVFPPICSYFFSFVLLLGKLVWILNICKNVSILFGQLAPGASLPVFLKAEGNWCMPNCSQNTDVVGTPLTTPTWGSAVNPVICQKVMLNLYDLSYFWPPLLTFKCFVLSLVQCHVLHCAGRTGLCGACEMCGFVTCVDSWCVRWAHHEHLLFSEKRGKHTALQKKN